MTTVAPMMAAPAAAPTTPDAPAGDAGFGAEYEQVAARVDRARGARTGASGRDHRADEASNEDAAVEESEQSEHVDESAAEVPPADAAVDEPTVDDATTEPDAAAATLAVAAPAPVANVPTDGEANAATTSVGATTSGIDPSTSAVAAPDADAELADGSEPVAAPAADAAASDGAAVVSEDAPVSSDRSAPAQGLDEDASSAPVGSETETGSAAPDASVEADAATPTGPRSVEAPARADGAANSAEMSGTRRADGVASTAASARADAAPTAQTTRTEAWEQVATVVRPLRLTADGSHRVALQLTPDDLGTVHLEVALRDGRLSVHAVAETAAARDALAGSLPQLRATLTSSGIDLGNLDVSDGSSGSDPDGRSGTERGKGSGRPARSDVLLRPGPAGPPTLVHTTHRHGGTAGPGAVDLAL
jgi:flagellar hook-length control protein FliK